MWECKSCHTFNYDTDDTCSNCKEPKPNNGTSFSYTGKSYYRYRSGYITFNDGNSNAIIPAFILFFIGCLINIIALFTSNIGYAIFPMVCNFLQLFLALAIIIVAFFNQETSVKLAFGILPVFELINGIIVISAGANGTSIFTLILSIALFLVGFIGFIMFCVESFTPAKVLFMIYIIFSIVGAISGIIISGITCGQFSNYAQVKSYYSALIFTYIFMLGHSIVMLVYICKSIARTYVGRIPNYHLSSNLSPASTNSSTNSSAFTSTPKEKKTDEFDSSVKKLKSLKTLLDQGIISEEEYEEKRKKYLKDI